MIKLKDTNLKVLQGSIVDYLQLDDYICWGYVTYRDKRKRNDDYVTIRMDDVDYIMSKTANDYNLRLDKLCYFTKDETSPDGFGHPHVLVGKHNLPKSVTSKEFVTKLNKRWNDEFGLAGFQPFNNDNKEKVQGLKYIAKATQEGVTVFNGYRFSRGLRRRLGYLQEHISLARN